MDPTTSVLFAPRNISGQASEYAAAIAPHGFHGRVWSYGLPAFGFDADLVVDKQRYVTDARYRWDIIDRAVTGFDTFHFQYASSLLIPRGHSAPDLWDLPMLKSMGKRVFMHFRGSDVRLRSRHLEREPDSYFRSSGMPCDEDAILGRIEICRRFCDDLFVSTPGLLDYVPDATWVPHAIDPTTWEHRRGPEPAVPVVSHVPSRRGTKSSDTVDQVLADLHARGVCVYRPLSGLSRTQLRVALQTADIVVDSLGIGDHGLISVEAMAAGTIAVGHIHPRNRERNPGVPVVEASAADLGEVIAALAGDPDRRGTLRRVGQDWVRQRHDRALIGAFLAERYSAPVTVPDVSYPAWPRSECRARVVELETQLTRARAEHRQTLRAWLRRAPRQPMSPTSLRRRVRRRLAGNLLLRRFYQRGRQIVARTQRTRDGGTR